MLHVETKKLDGILLENQWSHFRFDSNLLEICEPAIRRNQGIVTAKEDLMLEECIRVLHKVRWEILGRPTGEVDIDLRFMQTHRQSLVLPGERWMSHDNWHIGEVNCNVIQVHGIGVLEMYTSTAAHASADARMPGVEYGWQTRLRDHLVENIGTPVIWVEFLYRRVKFEASYSELFNESAGLARAHLPLRGIDASKWN